MAGSITPPRGRPGRPGKYFVPAILARISNLTLLARHVVEGLMAGLHRSSLHGLSVEFSEHRPYAPGDELRHIDWKLFGRQDRYFVKEYEAETNLKAYIFLDASASMGYGREGVSKLEYGSFITASLAYLMLLQRDAVGLVTMEGGGLNVIPPRSSSHHLRALTNALEKLRPSGRTDISAALKEVAGKLHRRGLFVIISDLIDDPDGVELGIRHLHNRKNDIMVFHVADRDELEFPFNRVTLFRDLEEEFEVTTDPREIRGEYRRAVGEHLRRVKGLCHSNSADYDLFLTDEPLHQSLVRYLARRGSF
jgi:uncharacterized protein (DUF58 family)